jgi:Ca2+-binding RTX toxin-like protein
VVESVGEGVDSVLASTSVTLDANVENLTLTGGSNLNAAGNTLANVITGNSGNNVLEGLGGADTLAGAGGNDTLIASNLANLAQADGGLGADVLRFTATGGAFNLASLMGVASNFETLNLRDTSNGIISLSSLSLTSITDAARDLTLLLDTGDTLSLSGTTTTATLSSGSGFANYSVYATADQSGPADATLHVIWG